MYKLFCYTLLIALCFACKNDYKIRVTNYYIEALDTVIVGKNKLVFDNVQRQSTTEYKKIENGTFGVLCISKNKTKFSTNVTIPVKGNGNRTIQIDGLGKISILVD